jgi:formylmethanofuran dehydrogenase subunit E
MSDLISRQAAIDALHMHLMYRMGTDSNKKRLDEWINNLPSAQPEPRQRHGMWILEVSPFGKVYVKCSECGEYALNDTEGEQVKSKCCPSCGIKMLRGEADDDLGS